MIRVNFFSFFFQLEQVPIRLILPVYLLIYIDFLGQNALFSSNYIDEGIYFKDRC